MIDAILRDLRQPEYMHALINPLPVYGLAMALLGLLIAFFLKNRRAQIVALILVLISAASAWPAYELGEQAYDRVFSMADRDGQIWLDEHLARAERLINVFYLLGLLAAAGIFFPIKWPRLAAPLTVVVILVGLATFGIGGYIAYAGGKVRHREFRNVPPPAERSDQKP